MSRAEAEAKTAVQHPMGRNATCKEAAAPVLFLASKQAAFITGTGACVEGLQIGLSSGSPTEQFWAFSRLQAGPFVGWTIVKCCCLQGSAFLSLHLDLKAGPL